MWMSKEIHQPIQVFVRVRPCTKEEETSKNFNLIIRSPTQILIKNKLGVKDYTFDGIFDVGAKQLEVFKSIGEPALADIINGYNSTIIIYGQTGTGKTYTMIGKTVDSQLSWNESEMGIIPRTISRLFQELETQGLSHDVHVSYLEIYNEKLFDLLSPVEDVTKLKLYDDKSKKGDVLIEGLHEKPLSNALEVFALLKRGAEKRRVAGRNPKYGVSHTIFRVTVTTRRTTPEGQNLLKTAKLYLVDLAGGLNVKNESSKGLRAREVASINTSLLTLGRCMSKLIERSAHIPYRESKLTRILQDSLGGKTRTILIATVSSSPYNVLETMNTLNYLSRTKGITNIPTISQCLQESELEIQGLERQLNSRPENTTSYIDSEKIPEKEEEHRDEMKEKKDGIMMIEQYKCKDTCTDTGHTCMSVEELKHELSIASQVLLNLRAENRLKDDLIREPKTEQHWMQYMCRILLHIADTTSTNNEHMHNKIQIVRKFLNINNETRKTRVAQTCTNLDIIKSQIIEIYGKQIKFCTSMLLKVKEIQRKQKGLQYHQIKTESHIEDIYKDLEQLSNYNNDTERDISKSLIQLHFQISVNKKKFISNLDSLYSPILSNFYKLQELIHKLQYLNSRILTEAGEVQKYNLNSTIRFCKEIAIVVHKLNETMKFHLHNYTKVHRETTENIGKIESIRKDHAEKLNSAKIYIEQVINCNQRQSKQSLNLYDNLHHLVQKKKICNINYNEKQMYSLNRLRNTFAEYWQEMNLYTQKEFHSTLDMENKTQSIFNDATIALDQCKISARNLASMASQIFRDTGNETVIELNKIFDKRQSERDQIYQDLSSKADVTSSSDLSEKLVASTKLEKRNILLRRLGENCNSQIEEIIKDVDSLKEDTRLMVENFKEYKRTGNTPRRDKYKYPQLLLLYKQQRSASMSRMSPGKKTNLIRCLSDGNLNQIN